MTSKQVTAQAVAALFVSANRNATKAELNLYHAALSTESDEDVQQAVVEIVRNVDLGQRAPSPALIIETVRSIQRRRALERNQPALPEHAGPLVDHRDLAAKVREARAAMHARKEPA